MKPDEVELEESCPLRSEGGRASATVRSAHPGGDHASQTYRCVPEASAVDALDCCALSVTNVVCALWLRWLSAVHHLNLFHRETVIRLGRHRW